LKLSTKYKLSV